MAQPANNNEVDEVDEEQRIEERRELVRVVYGYMEYTLLMVEPWETYEPSVVELDNGVGRVEMEMLTDEVAFVGVTLWFDLEDGEVTASGWTT